LKDVNRIGRRSRIEKTENGFVVHGIDHEIVYERTDDPNIFSLAIVKQRAPINISP
jgi:hypothetical protein